MKFDVDNKSFIFSEVEFRTEDKSSSFYAAGIPDQYNVDDFNEFDDFLGELEDDTLIHVNVSSYLFGDGESDHADEDELEYIKDNFDKIDNEYGISLIQSDSFHYYHEVQ